MASRSKTSTPESSDYAPDLLLSQSSRAPAPLRSSSAPVFSQPLSFSISRILGLEDNARQLQSTASLIPGKSNISFIYSLFEYEKCASNRFHVIRF